MGAVAFPRLLGKEKALGPGESSFEWELPEVVRGEEEMPVFSVCFLSVSEEECLHRIGAVGIHYFSFSFISIIWRISRTVLLWGLS